MQSINGASLRVLDSSIEKIALKIFESLLKLYLLNVITSITVVGQEMSWSQQCHGAE